MWLADLFKTRTPDRFFALTAAQAAIVVQAAGAFKEFVSAGARGTADRMDRLRQEGRDLLDRLTTALRDTFVTPIDRQDLYNLGESLDDMLRYLCSALQEINLFGVVPTPQMGQIAEALVAAAQQIQDAVAHLHSDPARAWRCAKNVQAVDGFVEDVYRRAVIVLFDEPDVHLVLKQREVYRHLSNSAGQARAIGRLIGKIVVKAT